MFNTLKHILGRFALGEHSLTQPRSWRWWQNSALAILLCSLAVRTVSAQSFQYEGASLEFAKITMNLTLTPLASGLYAVRGTVEGAIYPPWTVMGTYTPATKTLAAGLYEGNLCGAGVAAVHPIAGTLTGTLGDAGSVLALSLGVVPAVDNVCPPGFRFVSFALMPPPGAPAPPGPVNLNPNKNPQQAPPPAATYNGQSDFGNMRLVVSLTEQPNGQWGGTITVEVSILFKGVRMWIVVSVLRVTGVVNPGPPVELSLSGIGATPYSVCYISSTGPGSIQVSPAGIPSFTSWSGCFNAFFPVHAHK